MSKKKTVLIASIAAGVLVLAGGGVAASVAVSNYNAETEAMCAKAVATYDDAIAASASAAEAASQALASIEVTELPDGAGTTTRYADRPATDTQPAGAEVVAAVTGAVETADATVECADRDQAAAITADAKALTADVDDLTAATEALTADFASFQESEKARIEAEREAACIAAEQEAARVAVEQAAAAQRAAAAKRSSGSTGGSASTGGSSGSLGGASSGGSSSGSYNGGGNGGAIIPNIPGVSHSCAGQTTGVCGTPY